VSSAAAASEGPRLRRVRSPDVDEDPAASERLVARRTSPASAIRLLRVLRGTSRPVCHGPLWWPIFLLCPQVRIELPLRRSAREVEVGIALDGVTGAIGPVDVRMPDVSEREVDRAAVLTATVEPEEVEDELRERTWEEVVRRYRPSAVPDIELGDAEALHLPYHVVTVGDEMYLVDLMMRRVDPIDYASDAEPLARRVVTGLSR
jgi:hypothetical protein